MPKDTGFSEGDYPRLPKVSSFLGLVEAPSIPTGAHRAKEGAVRRLSDTAWLQQCLEVAPAYRPERERDSAEGATALPFARVVLDTTTTTNPCLCSSMCLNPTLIRYGVRH